LLRSFEIQQSLTSACTKGDRRGSFVTVRAGTAYC